VSAPCDFDKKYFCPFSLEIKLFDTKLYFTWILVHEFEKKKRFIEKLQR